jgi:hypothetical protein
MFYELWDVEIGKGLARYQSDTEIAQLIRSLIDHHGDDYVLDLDLLIEDDQGQKGRSYSGADLVAWIDETLERASGHTERSRRTALSQSGAIDRGAA